MKQDSTGQYWAFFPQIADLYVIKSQNKKNENVTCSMSAAGTQKERRKSISGSSHGDTGIRPPDDCGRGVLYPLFVRTATHHIPVTRPTTSMSFGDNALNLKRVIAVSQNWWTRQGGDCPALLPVTNDAVPMAARQTLPLSLTEWILQGEFSA